MASCNYILAGHGLLTWNEIEAFFSESHWKASGGESSEFKSTLPQSQVLRSFTIFSSSSSNVLCSLLMEFYNEWDGISINPFLSIEHTNTINTLLKRHEKPFEMMKSDLKPVWIWWRWFLCVLHFGAGLRSAASSPAVVCVWCQPGSSIILTRFLLTFSNLLLRISQVSLCHNPAD